MRYRRCEEVIDGDGAKGGIAQCTRYLCSRVHNNVRTQVRMCVSVNVYESEDVCTFTSGRSPVKWPTGGRVSLPGN